MGVMDVVRDIAGVMPPMNERRFSGEKSGKLAYKISEAVVAPRQVTRLWSQGEKKEERQETVITGPVEMGRVYEVDVALASRGREPGVTVVDSEGLKFLPLLRFARERDGVVVRWGEGSTLGMGMDTIPEDMGKMTYIRVGRTPEPGQVSPCMVQVDSGKVSFDQAAVGFYRQGEEIKAVVVDARSTNGTLFREGYLPADRYK